MVIAKIITGVIIGLLNAFRGSGWLQEHGKELLATLLKWVIIPLALICSTLHFGGNYVMAIALSLPYFWFMATGTGACMQANINNPIESTKGWPPFANICDKIARAILKIPASVTDLPTEYYRLWGFLYATLVGIVFSSPFLLTQYVYGIPLLFFGVTCRYLIWRKNEFLLLAVQSGMFLLSLV
jgi:hypothetical protein